MSYAEPFVAGKVHGLAKQFDVHGHLMMVSPFVRGSGVDFWCDEEGRLAEEHPLVDGTPSGCHRWWNQDGKSVYSETQYRDGLQHGVSREWSSGKLGSGFPKFFLAGKPVSRRRYLDAGARDSSIPPYRLEEDRPHRKVPSKFSKLKARAARLRNPELPTPVRTFPRPVSEEPVVMGRVVAERRYQVGSDWILLQIGTPHRTTWRSDFYCPVRIVGRQTKLFRAFGVDSVQALMLAFDLAKTKLESMRPPAYWDASERLGDVGIDKRITTGLGIDFDKQVEQTVDRMLVAEGRRREKAARQGRQ